MGLIIDTTFFIHAERRGLDLNYILATHQNQEMFISVITVSELMHGVHRALTEQIKIKRRNFAEAVFNIFPAIPIDSAIAREHARVTAELALSGKTIGINDSWLAATC